MVMKSRRMSWERHVTLLVYGKCNILLGKLEGNTSLEDLGVGGSIIFFFFFPWLHSPA
jgi:hypothetical protein